MPEIDAARAIILARAEQLGLNLVQLSRAIGANSAYIQQYLRRGVPLVLPEDKRERLAHVLSVPPDALRGASPSKGGPRSIPTSAVAATPAEEECLETFRTLDPPTQTRALSILKTLAA